MGGRKSWSFPKLKKRRFCFFKDGNVESLALNFSCFSFLLGGGLLNSPPTALLIFFSLESV